MAYTKELMDTENFVNSVINAPEDQFEFVFTIRKNNKFAGLISFKDSDKANKKTEIGYWLSENFHKQGIVMKSVNILCDFTFKKQEINEVLIKCAIENKPSINIPKKLGFKFVGIEQDGELLSGSVTMDTEIYSKLKSDKTYLC